MASVDRVSILSANMLTNSRPRCRPRLDQVLVEMLFELIDHQSTLSVGTLADTSADMLRSTVGGVSVDCQWCQSIVSRCFAEIAAVSLTTGDTKEESIAYEHIPGCPIDGKKQSIDRYQLIKLVNW